MAYGGGTYEDITLPAAADLSSYQYHFVTVDANGRGTITTAATTPVIGILQNKPSAAEAPARIRVSGISKLAAGAALNEAERVCSTPQDATSLDGHGFGTVAAATSIGVFIGAIVLAACGASADITDLLVTRYQI